MTDQLERALTRTLAAAARVAPVETAELQAGLATSRPRRRTMQGALVAAAIVAVLGGTAVGVRLAMPERQAPAVSWTGIRPVAQAWPNALYTAPTRLPNGQAYQPFALLDSTTILATTEGSFEKVDAVWSYDLRTGRAARIVNVPIPAGTTGLPTGFVTGNGLVAWWLQRGPTVEFWSAPLSGGDPGRLGTALAGPAPDHLVAVDGWLVWSGSTASGVYRLPLTGGNAELIDGTSGYHLLQWPWAGTPWDATSWSNGAPSNVTYRLIRNVLTGEERTANGIAPTGELWGCGLDWCVSAVPSPSVAQRRNGSGRRELRGTHLPEDGVWGRFATVVAGQGADSRLLLARLDQEQAADLNIRPNTNGGLAPPRSFGPADRFLYWPTADGKRYYLLDLDAIR